MCDELFATVAACALCSQIAFAVFAARECNHQVMAYTCVSAICAHVIVFFAILFEFTKWRKIWRSYFVVLMGITLQISAYADSVVNGTCNATLIWVLVSTSFLCHTISIIAAFYESKKYENCDFSQNEEQMPRPQHAETVIEIPAECATTLQSSDFRYM
jgi:hypothetical protein